MFLSSQMKTPFHSEVPPNTSVIASHMYLQTLLKITIAIEYALKLIFFFFFK